MGKLWLFPRSKTQLRELPAIAHWYAPRLLALIASLDSLFSKSLLSRYVHGMTVLSILSQRDVIGIKAFSFSSALGFLREQ